MAWATEALNEGQANAGFKAVSGETRDIGVATFSIRAAASGVGVKALAWCVKVADYPDSIPRSDREFLGGLLFKQGRNYENHCII
jgi:hypothetical protein